MNEIKIVPVNNEAMIDEVARLAKKIWYDHYSTIIDEGQIEYMVNKYQSKKAVKQQIEEENYEYFLFEYNGEYAGYFGMKKEKESIFLSKLYIDKDYRRKGIATKGIDFLCKICVRDSLNKIWLTVNRNNKGSVAAYEHLGFVTARTQVADIGEGYVMDDYIMEKLIS